MKISEFEGKTALITGAAGGFGSAIARRHMLFLKPWRVGNEKRRAQKAFLPGTLLKLLRLDLCGNR